MIFMPNKHVPLRRSLIGIGAHILKQLHSSMTVSELWEIVENKDDIGSFGNFILSLDYLYAIGAIDYESGFLTRTQR